ncbi:MAG: hypothetical protein ACJATA_001808 [Sphingobacteriales bacterium]|jgi:hypothetical protein
MNPNPSVGNLTFEYTNNIDEKTSLSIFNTHGKLVFNQVLPNKTVKGKLEVVGLSSGIYYAKMATASGIFNQVKKIIIQ